MRQALWLALLIISVVNASSRESASAEQQTQTLSQQQQEQYQRIASALQHTVAVRDTLLAGADKSGLQAEQQWRDRKIREALSESEHARFKALRREGYELRTHGRYFEAADKDKAAMMLYLNKLREPWEDVATYTRLGQTIEARFAVKREVMRREQLSFREREHERTPHVIAAFNSYKRSLNGD